MATETDSHATISSPEDALSAAQNAGTRYQHLYKGLQCETNELQSVPTVELLGIDVDRRLSEATGLCSSYVSNSVRISELLEKLHPGDLEAAEHTIFSYRKKIQQLADDLTHLRAVKDAYKGSLSMKKLVQQLNTTDSLTGPARQADVQALWKYVMGFSSDLLSLKNSDVQDLYDEVAALSANIFKRSEQQLLNSTSSPSSGDPKPSTTPVPRPSTLTLKLPTFHGSVEGLLGLFLALGERDGTYRC